MFISSLKISQTKKFYYYQRIINKKSNLSSLFKHC